MTQRPARRADREPFPRAWQRPRMERPAGDTTHRALGTGRDQGQGDDRPGPGRASPARSTDPPESSGRPHQDREWLSQALQWRDHRRDRPGPRSQPAPGDTAVRQRRDRRGTAGRGATALLVARPAAVHPDRQRLPPAGAALPRLPRGAAVRPRPAHARAARPEGRRARPGAAQRGGQHPVPAVQPRIRPAVEQPGDRPGRTGRHRHPLGLRQRPPDRLLDHRRPRPRTSSRRYADATGHAPMLPGLGLRVLAVQAALPHPGRAARGGPRVRPARPAAVGHRLRLLPLDPPGRLEVRPGGVARPGRDGRRTELDSASS